MQPYIFEVLIANIALYGTSQHSVSLKKDFSSLIGTDERSIKIVKDAWITFMNIDKEIRQKNKSRKYKQRILSMKTLEYSIAT